MRCDIALHSRHLSEEIRSAQRPAHHLQDGATLPPEECNAYPPSCQVHAHVGRHPITPT